MAQQTQTTKTATKAPEEAPTEHKPADTAKADKLKAEADALLDEIDALLEENAEDFVAAYVQKGGQ